MAAATQIDWTVTEEKISELVRRIVEAADPLEVIAFGSRAPGDHREDSDLDLAVIVENEAKARHDLRDVRNGIPWVWIFSVWQRPAMTSSVRGSTPWLSK